MIFKIHVKLFPNKETIVNFTRDDEKFRYIADILVVSKISKSTTISFDVEKNKLISSRKDVKILKNIIVKFPLSEAGKKGVL